MTSSVNDPFIGSRHTTICMTTLSQLATHAVIVTPDPSLGLVHDHDVLHAEHDGDDAGDRDVPQGDAETPIAAIDMLEHQSHAEIHSFFHGPPAESEHSHTGPASSRTAPRSSTRRPIRKTSSLSTVAEVASQRSMSISMLDVRPGPVPSSSPRPTMDLDAIRALARAALESPSTGVQPHAAFPFDHEPAHGMATHAYAPPMAPFNTDRLPALLPCRTPLSPNALDVLPSPMLESSECSHQSTSRLLLPTSSWIPRPAPAPPSGHGVGSSARSEPTRSQGRSPAKLRKAKPPGDSDSGASRPLLPRTPPQTTWSSPVVVQGEECITGDHEREVVGKKTRRPLLGVWIKRRDTGSSEGELAGLAIHAPDAATGAVRAKKGSVLRRVHRASTSAQLVADTRRDAVSNAVDSSKTPDLDGSADVGERPSLFRRLSSKVRSRRVPVEQEEQSLEAEDGTSLLASRPQAESEGPDHCRARTQASEINPYAALHPLPTALQAPAVPRPWSSSSVPLSGHRRSKSSPGINRRLTAMVDTSLAQAAEIEAVMREEERASWPSLHRASCASGPTVDTVSWIADGEVPELIVPQRAQSLQAIAAIPGNGNRASEEWSDIKGSSAITSIGHDEVSRRRSRKLLLQIDDDIVFASVAEKLLGTQESASGGNPSLGGADSHTRGFVPAIQLSPHLDDTTSDIVRAYFVVREVVQGERRFVKYILQGIQRLKWQLDGTPLLPPVPSRSSSLKKPVSRPASLFVPESITDVRIPVRASSYPPHNKPSRSDVHSTTSSRHDRPSSRAASTYDEPVSPTGSDRATFRDALAASYAHLRPAISTSSSLAGAERGAWADLLQQIYVTASDMLHRFESDPSPAYLAETFVSMQPALQDAFAEWAEVAMAVSLSGLGRETIHKRKSTPDGSRRRRQSLGSKAHKRESTDDRLHLSDILIMPIQRVAQYPLLFRQLRHHVTGSSRDSAAVQKALEAATEIIEECNRRQGTLLPPVSPSA